jgi:hypothetical protein
VKAANKLNDIHIRQELEQFWSTALEIAPPARGYSIALPQTMPDGWQIVVDLEAPLPKGIRLTDQGRTLGWLHAQGQNIRTDAIKRHLQQICEQSELTLDGLEVYRWLPQGLSAVDLHVFTEGLINIAHLHYLHEAKPRAQDVPDQTLRRVFADHHVEAEAGYTLDGHARKNIRLDYYVASPAPAAFQIIRRHGRILSTMEQWGYRWHDLRVEHPELRPAMIYDPHHQEIDADSRAIGEDVCELFCSYEETDRIHEFLGV